MVIIRECTHAEMRGGTYRQQSMSSNCESNTEAKLNIMKTTNKCSVVQSTVEI